MMVADRSVDHSVGSRSDPRHWRSHLAARD